LPSLRAKENDVLLRELLKRWSTHKVITCWLSRFFRSLEIFGITEISLEKIGFLSFYDLVGHDNISLKLSFLDNYNLLTKLHQTTFRFFFK
jgi:cullin 1